MTRSHVSKPITASFLVAAEHVSAPTANSPRSAHYDCHHNTPADQNADAQFTVAEQSVYHGGDYRLRLILPVIPRRRVKRTPAWPPLITRLIADVGPTERPWLLEHKRP